jgi:hypothetical protein
MDRFIGVHRARGEVREAKGRSQEERGEKDRSRTQG